ncbi:MAG: PAS domain S-box protein [Elusimicrobiales bacterium]|nr:PAS domain S-box protein [Elusimicrobiales bacterium]
MPDTKDGFLSKLFEDSPYGIMVADESARIVEVNPAACAMFGYSLEEFRNLRVHDILAPESVHMAEKHFANLEPDSGFMLLYHKRKNGEIFPVELGVRRTIYNGRPALMGMQRDISAAKKAEAELARTRDLYQKMLDTSLDAVLLLDLDLKVVTANSRTAEFLRIPDVSALTGTDAKKFIIPEEWPGIEEYRRKVLGTGTARNMNFTGVRADGEHFPVEMNASIFTGEDGRPAGLLVTSRDISERVKAESEIRETEKWLTAVLDHSPIYIFLSRGGKLEYVNKTALADAGVADSGAMLGKSVLDFVAPEYREAMAERVRTLIETGNPVPPLDIELTTPDGRRVPVSIYSAPFQYKGDGIIVTFALNIAAFKEAGRAARASQELYRTLTRAMPDFIYALDTEGRITYCNRWLEQFREDPTGKTQHEVFPKETADKHLAVIKKVMGTGEPSTRVEEIEYPGRKVYFENRLFPVKDESGRTTSLIGVTRDVSDQKTAESRLKASEERYRYLFDNAADPIFIHDDKGRILGGNQALCDTYGYTPEELRGLTLDRVDTPEDAARIPERMDALFRTGSARFTTSHLRKNGERITADVRASLITWQGRPAIMSICRDITERQRAEEMLRRSEEKFSLVFRSSPYGQIITRVPDGTILDVNEAITAMSGYTREEMIDRTTTELRVWENEAFREKLLREISEKGRARNLRFNFRIKSGEVLPADYSGALIKIGDEAHIISTIIDLTEKQRAEAALAEVQRLEALSMIAGGLAHDFNNMLAGIMGNLSLLEMDLMDSRKKELLGYVAEALEGVNSCRSLMHQFSTFAKGTRPARKRFSLCSTVSKAAALAMTGSSSVLDIKTPQALPDIDGDESQIFQTVNNIVLNAAQAMPGGGTVTVELSEFAVREKGDSPLEPGRYIRIDISDNGIGMTADVLSRIFDPYFSTKGKGRGLGLPMAFSVARSHGGYIEASSAPGRGTRFSVYLPCLETYSSCAPAKPVRPKLHKGSGLVLVLEDDESVTEMLSAMLKASGYTPVTAADGKTALRLFREKGGAGSFKAVIMDLVIPGGMGGKECLEELRKEDPAVAAMATSGYSDYPVMTGPEKYGFDSALPKPYSSEEFGGAMTAALDKAAGRKRDGGKTRKRSKQ